MLPRVLAHIGFYGGTGECLQTQSPVRPRLGSVNQAEAKRIYLLLNLNTSECTVKLSLIHVISNWYLHLQKHSQRDVVLGWGAGVGDLEAFPMNVSMFYRPGR